MQHPIVNAMLPNVVNFLQSESIPNLDEQSICAWQAQCMESWSELSSTFLTSQETAYGTSILSTLLGAYTDLAKLVQTKRISSAKNWTEKDRIASIQRLLHAPQIEQRTTEWYQDALGLLSASQFNTILKSGRTRGHLVLQKAGIEPVDHSQRRTVVLTQDLNPFTWGIRFEPVVKQIYQNLTATRVAELGRLRHTVDKHLAASPDGLVTEGPLPRLGRFVEFKAPVTRKILSIVPDDYFAQMQIQMEVGGVEECDYLEVKFESQYGIKTPPAVIPSVNPSLHAKWFYGNIFVIGSMETCEPVRYEYSPLNDTEWKPTLVSETEVIIETVPWWSTTWFITTVERSNVWFEKVQPAIRSFWEDVAKAKEGQFDLPASQRKQKEVMCLIQAESSPMWIEPEPL
jgi:hypothetical protein